MNMVFIAFVLDDLGIHHATTSAQLYFFIHAFLPCVVFCRFDSIVP